MADFADALDFIKNGRQVRRLGWNSTDQFIFLVPGSTFVVNRPPLSIMYPEGTEIEYQPHIDMKTVQGTIVPWIASQSDLLANDWVTADGN